MSFLDRLLAAFGTVATTRFSTRDAEVEWLLGDERKIGQPMPMNAEGSMGIVQSMGPPNTDFRGAHFGDF